MKIRSQLIVSILVVAAFGTGCDKIKSFLKRKEPASPVSVAPAEGEKPALSANPPAVPAPAVKPVAQADYIDPMEAVQKEIERNPNLSLREVVEFANKQIAAGIGVPLTFLSLGVDPMKSLSDGETENGIAVRFTDRDMRLLCGQKGYSVIASQIGEKKIQLRIQGKSLQVKMPSEFSPGMFRILSKDGNELAKIFGPSDMLPTHVSPNGKEVYFAISLTSYPTAVLNAWWTRVTSEIRGGAGRLPSLVYGISSTGEIKFTADTKLYKISGSSTALKTVARDGTHLASFLYETGQKVDGKNLCVNGGIPAAAPVIGGPIIPPTGGIGGLPTHVKAPQTQGPNTVATPRPPTVVHPPMQLPGGLAPGAYPGSGPGGGPPKVAVASPNVPSPPSLANGPPRIAPPTLPNSLPPPPPGPKSGQIGAIPGGPPNTGEVPAKPPRP
jgi:hypothetical protein